MERKYKERLVERQSIYIDSKRLLDWLYFVRWKVNRRDRAYLFDTLLIPYTLSMIGYFYRGYRFRDERLKAIDEFLFCFDRVEALLDLASEKKIITDKSYSASLEWLVRIEDGVRQWRASARKANKEKQPGAASNDGGSAEMELFSRGGDGLIQPSSGSAP